MHEPRRNCHLAASEDLPEALPMKRRTYLLLAVLLLVPLATWAVMEFTSERAHWPRPEILDALRMVESSDRANPPDGDDGKAIGPYQIWEIYWTDAKAFDPDLGGSYQDCRDRAYAERVIDAYMRRYAADAWASGHAETIARTHNGGPKGPTKDTTLPYWQRVRSHLR